MTRRAARRLRVLAALAAAALCTACVDAASPAATAAGGSVQPGRAPSPVVLAQGVSSANPAHLFRSRAWDFTRMREVFNAVALLPGDPTAVAAARRAGLAVVLEFDYKADFFAGQDISAKVAAVVAQIRAAPRSVIAVHVADRLNEKYDPDQDLRYLAATAGVLHRRVPGIPVLVNLADWQLSCGYPGQSSCTGHDEQYQWETNATLDRIYRSGYVDGFTVADNLKNEDAAAQATAWQEARRRWPAPFLLWSTCSQVSFPGARYSGSPAADRLTAAYLSAPMAAGADGVALWAWHQLYEGAVYTFLDKSGAVNALWQQMTAVSRDTRHG